MAPELFSHLFGLGDAELAALGVRRYVVDATPGYPDRIEMRDLQRGERALLLNYVHQSANSPYRSSHAIFVGEGATQRYDRVNEVPEVMLVRPMSLRAFDADHMMVEADLAEGAQVEPLVRRYLSDPRVAYVHAHNAKRGCYAGFIERA